METLLTSTEAAEFLGIKEQSLRARRTRDAGPPFTKNGKKVRYDRAELQRWMDARVRDDMGRWQLVEP